MLRSLTFAAAAAASLAASTPASAQAVQVGILECGGGPTIGWIVVSSAPLNCVFRPGTGRGAEGYTAVVNRVGLDAGVTSWTGLTWLVFAPSASLARGSLAGVYGGTSANASLIVGGGVNVLLGGSNRTITLQPVSVQGQWGVNVAATVTNVELIPTAPVTRSARVRVR
jgi:hypothetical protein